MQHPPGDDFTNVGKEPGVTWPGHIQQTHDLKTSMYEFLKMANIHENLTWMTSTPGMVQKALVTPWSWS